MEDLPERIKQKKEELIALEGRIEEIDRLMSSQEIPIRIEVADAVSPSGKPLFGNEQRRMDEVEMRLRQSADYMDLLEQKKFLVYQKKQLLIEIEYLENKFAQLFWETM